MHGECDRRTHQSGQFPVKGEDRRQARRIDGTLSFQTFFIFILSSQPVGTIVSKLTQYTALAKS